MYTQVRYIMISEYLNAYIVNSKQYDDHLFGNMKFFKLQIGL